MAIIVTPRTEAECNQLRSVLHSRGRNLVGTCEWPAIKVGRSVITWHSGAEYAVQDTSASIIAMVADEYVPVNALYNRLLKH